MVPSSKCVYFADDWPSTEHFNSWWVEAENKHEVWFTVNGLKLNRLDRDKSQKIFHELRVKSTRSLLYHCLYTIDDALKWEPQIDNSYQ